MNIYIYIMKVLPETLLVAKERLYEKLSVLEGLNSCFLVYSSLTGNVNTLTKK